MDAVVLLGDGGVKRAVLVVRLTGAVQHLGLAVGADALNDQNMAERFAGPFPFAGVEATPAGVGRRGGVGLHGADAPGERGLAQAGVLGLGFVTEAGGQGVLCEQGRQEQNQGREEAVHDNSFQGTGWRG